MTLYNIIVTNDMGNLSVYSRDSVVPKHIISFVDQKTRNKINLATDKKNMGYLFIILKKGLNDTWTYHVGNDTIIVNYELNNFDPKITKYM